MFTHASWAADRTESYERLEFLGDSVLELSIAHTLYERFPEFEEGQMAKLRSQVVSRASCAVIAAELGLGERLLELHPGPESDEPERLSRNRNVLAALLEAALAAIYLEHGFETASAAIVDTFDPRIEYALTHKVDHKTELQEELARRGRSVSYTPARLGGPRSRAPVHRRRPDRRRAGRSRHGRLEEGRRARGCPRGARRARAAARSRVGAVSAALGKLRRACT